VLEFLLAVAFLVVFVPLGVLLLDQYFDWWFKRWVRKQYGGKK